MEPDPRPIGKNNTRPARIRGRGGATKSSRTKVPGKEGGGKKSWGRAGGIYRGAGSAPRGEK